MSDNPRVLITALGIGQICSWGSFYYSFPLIVEAMTLDLGWSKADVYGAVTIGLVLAGLLAYPVGLAVDRGHGRTLMGGASVIVAALMALWSQVDGLVSFYLLIAGIGALQAATLYEPAFAVIARRVGPANTRTGITALTLWAGFASTLFIPFVQFLLDQWGWRNALLVLAFINLAVCAVAYLTFIRPQLDVVTVITPDRAGQATSDEQEISLAIRKPVFWALMVATTAYAAMFSAFTFHMYPMLLERGIDTGSVVTAIATIGPAQVLARVLVSVFGSRLSVRRIGAFVVTMFPLAFGALILLPSNVRFIIAVFIVLGAANGIFTIVRGLVVPEMLGRRAYGAINGLLAIPGNLLRALAPVAAAWLWGMTGSYGLVLWAIVAAAVILAISFWMAAFLSKYVKKGSVFNVNPLK
ncbi:MAG: MFS transporter [Paralcaligenes sp.]